MRGPRIPKGPAGTLKDYFRRLRIVTDDSGMSWSCEGISPIHVINSPLKAIGHFLRHAARLEWIRNLQEKRQNMQGIQEIDLGLTAALSRKEGHVTRRFLIPVLTDAVWTMARRARCGLTDDPNCPWCPNTPEDLLHLWFLCPKWEKFRGPIRAYAEEITSSPRCTSHCFIATVNMSRALKRRWGAIQIAAATIYKARMDEHPNDHRKQPSPRGDDRGDRTDRYVVPVPVVVGPQVGVPYPFHYTERLQAGKVSWPFSRNTWREITW